MRLLELNISNLSGGRQTMIALTNNISANGSEHQRSEIEAAILSQTKQKKAIWSGSSITAAVSFDVDNNGTAIEIFHLGSTIKGGGSELVTAVKQFAKRKKLPIVANVHPDSVDFYKKQGFYQVDGSLFKFDVIK